MVSFAVYRVTVPSHQRRSVYEGTLTIQGPNSKTKNSLNICVHRYMSSHKPSKRVELNLNRKTTLYMNSKGRLTQESTRTGAKKTANILDVTAEYYRQEIRLQELKWFIDEYYRRNPREKSSALDFYAILARD